MEKRLSICFISPYLPKSFGGGEKYLLDCARLLARHHQVDVALPKLSHPRTLAQLEDIKKQYGEFLNKKLTNINFIDSPFFANSYFWQRLSFTKQFDVLYYQTDGSLFFSLAKKNILHIQIPFAINKNTFWDKIKLKNWQVINTNSHFTKKVIEKWWRVKVDFVHQPMIDFPVKKDFVKEKIILNVGRFFTHLHAKRQDILITTFIDMLKKFPRETAGWKLVLIGKVEDEVYLDKLVSMAKNYPIYFYHHLTKLEVNEYYQKASIYWHASGFEINELQSPEKVEHFGIAVVEAMSAGCVPIVYSAGGHKEIIDEAENGFLWKKKRELIKKTKKLLDNQSVLRKISSSAKKDALVYEYERFEAEVSELLS